MKKALNALCILFILSAIHINMMAQFSPINFSPNFGNTNPNILGIGIGNWPNFGATNSRLHISNFFCAQPNGGLNGFMFRTDANSGAFSRWQMFTGPNAGNLTEKGAFFASPNGNTQQGTVAGLGGVTNLGQNQFHMNAALGDIILCARGVNGFQNFQFSERMRISGYTAPIPNYLFPTVQRTRVSISNATPITVPLAMLHLGDPWNSFNIGPHRNWMDVGTYYHVDSDALYVGIKHLGGDRNEGIICFGNNPSAAPIGDRMRFLFAGAAGNGTSSGNPGLEFMHFYTSDGTNPRVSIGDFQTQGGNADPNNTLEILPSPLSPYWGWGAGNGSSTSGLRLQRLTSASTIVPNGTNGVDNTKVATVDINGDVVLTNPPPPDADNGCSMDGPTVGKVHLGNSVGNTQGKLLNDREVPLNNFNLIFSGQPDNFPGKVGVGIVGGINNTNPLSLRPSPITMQVNGSLSIFDGTGNTSIFFGEEQHPASSGTLGEWGIQYDAGGPGGLNFWKPFGSNGYNFGNKFLYLCNNGNVGIGATAPNPPANALEITSYNFNPQPAGLRFTNLTSSATPVTNPGTGVLAVDGNGDVIYVDASGSGANGFGYCPNPTALTGNAGINTSGNNFYYEGQSISGDYVGVGYACGSTLKAKLDVLEDGGTTTMLKPTIAVKGTNKDVIIPNAIDQYAYAFYGDCNGNQTGNGVFNVGGYFHGQNAQTGYNIGVFGEVAGGNNGNFAGYFKGDVYVNSPAGIGANYVALSSDSNLKTNITTISNADLIIGQLKPKSFYFDTTNTFGLQLPSNKQYGFVAQDVKPILPELITSITNPGDSSHAPYTYSALNYNAFIGLLTAGMQKQQLSIDSLRNASSGTVAAANGLSVNSGSVELGNSIGSLGAILNSNREIPMNGYDIYFAADNSLSSNKNRVLIGVDQGSTDGTNAKLYVQESVTGDVLGQYSTAIEGDNADNISSGPIKNLIGIRGVTYGGNNSFGANIGGSFQALNGTNHNHGVEGIAGSLGLESSGSIPTPANFVGGAFSATASGATQAIGVYATAPSSAGNYAGYFNGDMYVNGSNSGVGYVTASDAMFKTNVTPITNASGIISQLQPRSFFFDTSNAYKINFSDKKQYGLIAQDVQTVLPELVGSAVKPAMYDSSGNVLVPAVTYKTLNYDAFIALLLKSDQEKQARLDHQDSLINALVSQMDNCCNNGNHFGNSKSTNSTDVELSDADAIVLNQNVPNPFAEQTTISYNIPKSVSQAQILFYDINGRMIKSVDVVKKGKGQLNVFANDLSNGVYSYTLIADGKIIETKKMVKQQ